MYWLLAGIVALLALFVIALVPHNVRVWRARRAYQRVSPGVVEDVFTALQEAAPEQAAVTFLRPLAGSVCDDVTASHVGGLPYAEAGDTWPVDVVPGTFLVQVSLDDRGLPEVWRGRLIEIFLVFDLEQVVRSYEAQTRTKHVPIQPPAKHDPVPCVPLRHVRLCQWREIEEQISWSAQLVEDVPKVRQILSPFGRDVEGLLAQVLCPGLYGYNLAEPDTAFVGGDPVLIQQAHDPVCNVCGKPMRFLLQFGEIIPTLRLADGGVCYVYGCDEHPDCCSGFVDSH